LLGKACFVDREDPPHWTSKVETIRFEEGSKLREIEPGAFSNCHSLRKLLIPASVEKMRGAVSLRRGVRLKLKLGMGMNTSGGRAIF
jgi:hypothetical protein